jgi:O-acetyl-ADP-ribose deacetylase (regulator of RNase III)
MEARIAETRLVLKLGDITREEVDAIVNAANSSLLGGGGVDGAIHRAGGPEILAQTRKLGGCEPGDAKITTGGRLKAGYVIHTVGPIWHGGNQGEPETLASAYRRSLEKAVQNQCKTLSFPSISTGAYGYPIDLAARIALRTIVEYLRQHPGLKEVRMVLFSQDDLDVYSRELRGILGQI